MDQKEKKEGSTRYYYVVYHWVLRGGASGVGSCNITNTTDEFFIGSVTRDIAKFTGRTVIIASWREITESQSKEFSEYQAAEQEPGSMVEEVIRSKLNLKFESDPFKIKEWLEKPRREWLLQSANELIKFGDASRVLGLLEEEG